MTTEEFVYTALSMGFEIYIPDFRSYLTYTDVRETEQVMNIWKNLTCNEIRVFIPKEYQDLILKNRDKLIYVHWGYRPDIFSLSKIINGTDLKRYTYNFQRIEKDNLYAGYRVNFRFGSKTFMDLKWEEDRDFLLYPYNSETNYSIEDYKSYLSDIHNKFEDLKKYIKKCQILNIGVNE